MAVVTRHDVKCCDALRTDQLIDENDAIRAFNHNSFPPHQSYSPNLHCHRHSDKLSLSVDL